MASSSPANASAAAPKPGIGVAPSARLASERASANQAWYSGPSVREEARAAARPRCGQRGGSSARAGARVSAAARSVCACSDIDLGREDLLAQLTQVARSPVERRPLGVAAPQRRLDLGGGQRPDPLRDRELDELPGEL